MHDSNTRKWSVVLALVISSLFRSACADDRDFRGIVARVFDGDSFIVMTEHARRVEVRLADIDAPERDQPHADVARDTLIKLMDGRWVFVDVIGTDKYDRKVARVYREPDRLEIARALVHDGHVWVNRRFAKDRSLAALEDDAKSKQLGLWALAADKRVPPWEFRRTRTGTSAAPR